MDFENQALAKGLPSDINAERLVLGCCLIDSASVDAVLSLNADDLSLTKHQRLLERIRDLHARNEKIDYVTLANELRKHGQLESVDGLSYLVSLQEGLPTVDNLDAYINIVREKAKLRRLIFMGREIAEKAILAEQTPSEIVTEFQPKLYDMEADRGDGGATPIEIVTNFPGGIDVFLDPSRQKRGLPTGFKKFDEMTAGLHPGDVYMIAARPAMGKTSYALGIAEYLCLHPSWRRFVAIFSLEMTKESLLSRMACSLARVDSTRFRHGNLNVDERKKLQEALFQLTESHLKIYDKANPPMSEVSSTVRRLVRDEGLDLLILDYIQLMGVRSNQNRNQELGQISREFKYLAKDCNIPVLLLSQLSRITERRGGDMRPTLSDLRDSGNLEEDASVVAFIYREEVYKRDRPDLKGDAELIVSKNRHGAIGTARMLFLGNIIRFENRADWDTEPRGEENG